MTAPVTTPYRSELRPGPDGFGQLLRSEWTKFSTVRSWVIAMIAAAVLVALPIIALAGTAKNNNSESAPAIGPNGLAVNDSFYFQHRSVGGSGSITARVTSLTGHTVLAPGRQKGPLPPGSAEPRPWAKAGVIIKASTKAGSAYAAILVTPDHGVRFQYDFSHDVAGLGGPVTAGSPRWLRLTRTGEVISGYDSVNGMTWIKVGQARLAGLPATAEAGVFVASPQQFFTTQQVANNDGIPFPTVATAAFDRVALTGAIAGGGWQDTAVGGTGPGHASGPGGAVTLTGSGDIAPYLPIVDPIGLSYKGSLVGLITVIALAALFITSEYRRGLVRTTFTASPRRGRVLVAKAVVIGSATFVAGLAGAAVAYPIAQDKIKANGWLASIYPIRAITSGIGLQFVLGTAALFAIAAVLTLAVGALVRRSAGAIATGVLVLIFPLVLATVLPQDLGSWLLRLTPAAAFGLQQGNVHYSQVTASCLPYNGCYPLDPWIGFAVLCAWTLAALGLAIYVVRRRDA